MPHKLHTHRLHDNEGEVADIPFRKNDLKQHATTMDRPLDPSDGPGKADAELADELHLLENN
jgi:hypothetical protein